MRSDHNQKKVADITLKFSVDYRGGQVNSAHFSLGANAVVWSERFLRGESFGAGEGTGGFFSQYQAVKKPLTDGSAHCTN